MRKYEAMFILKPDLSEEERTTLCNQMSDIVSKNSGKVSQIALWSEKKKLYFTLKRYREGVYYVMNFTADPKAITDIKHAYQLNENILRVLITNIE